jgi:environmental stress-induced protein Ves
MTYQLIEAKHTTTQPWRNGGGQTRELLVWPNAANWQLRISRADITQDGPFSAFPGIQRWFAVLEGAGVVLHMPRAPCTLHGGDAPLSFDGGSALGCTLIDGPTQDLNLMVQHGKGNMLSVQSTSWTADFEMRGIYTVHAGQWSDGVQSLELPAHSLLWMEQKNTTARTNAWTFKACQGALLRAFWIGFTPMDQP